MKVSASQEARHVRSPFPWQLCRGLLVPAHPRSAGAIQRAGSRWKRRRSRCGLSPEQRGRLCSQRPGRRQRGTIVGAKWAASGVFGKALEFDGSGDCLSASFSSAPGIGTFEAWIHPDTTETWPLVSSPGTEYPSDFLISGAGTGLDLFSLAENTAGFTEAGVEASIPKSTWTHIAFTNGEAPTFYVDGSPLELEPLPTLSPTGWNLEFACSPSLGSFDGLIDEVRVYDRALSQGEIEEDMETPIAGGPTALPSVIESNTTLTAVNSPYEAAAPVTVAEGVTLTVEPGVTVKSPALSVDGTLIAEGTAEEPIVFTSLADSGPGEWEGIELNSGTSALEHVEVRNATTAVRSSGAIAPTIKESTIRSSSETAILLTGSDAKVLDNTLLSNHAGIGAFGGGSPAIDGNTIKNCGAGDFAIYYEGGSEASGEVEINDNDVENCGAPVTDPPLPASYPAVGVYGSGGATVVGKSVAGNMIKGGGRALDYFVQDPASSVPPNITENTITGNEADAIWVGGDVAESTTWDDNGFPIVFRNGFGLSVDTGVTLALGPGLVLKGEANAGIEVEGELIFEGASGNPVTVTSIRDDSVGGDINADGSETVPAPGDWGSIRFAEGTSEQPQGRGELLRLHVRFGGDASTCEEGYFTGDVCEAMVALNPPVESAVEPSVVEHSRFEFSATEGLGGRSVSPEVADSVFSFNRVGIRFTEGGAPIISGNEVADCAIDNPGIAYRSGNDGGAVRINANLVERCGVSEAPLPDAHGDITTVVDGEGEVVSRQAYDPWGAQLSGPGLEMGWLGAQQRRMDPTTELVQMGARPYNPALGSFVAEDPVLGTPGRSQSINRYPYAWDNPINLYDLDGREVCAGFLVVQGCLDSDGPSVDIEPCLDVVVAAACVGDDGPKVCVGLVAVPLRACEDPETAAKYGEACAVGGAFGTAVGAVFGKSMWSAITGAVAGCGSSLLEKLLRRLGEDERADELDAAGDAWDVAEAICSFLPKYC